MAGPLDGVKVVEMTIFQQGPVAGAKPLSYLQSPSPSQGEGDKEVRLIGNLAI